MLSEEEYVRVARAREESGSRVISVSGLKMKNRHSKGGFSSTIAHMPFSEGAISKSVLKLAKDNAALPNFEEGYKEWRQAKGGIFTITVAEAIDAMEQVLNQ